MKNICDKVKIFRGNLPKGFDAAVRILTRPYTKITEEEYNALWKMLDGVGNTDFFIYNGKVVTIGAADGGYAIMPLISEQQWKRTKDLSRSEKLELGIAC